MAISLHTNPTGLIARQNFSGNLFVLSDSVRRLSSGLRVTSAGDDPVTVTIASQLDAQASGLGQAVRNANDGMAAMQVVDASLSEAVDILGVIRTKAHTASLANQTSATRLSLQGDISKLLDELDQLIGAAKFHGVPLLTGAYTDKTFQVGNVSGETISLSLLSLTSTQIGQVRSGEMTLTSVRGGQVNLRLDNQGNDSSIMINTVSLAFANDPDQGMGALAGAINAYAETTGISAHAEVAVESESAITAGSTTGDFAINGIGIGAITVLAGDSDSRLVNAVNAKSASHGITAEVTEAGTLLLSSPDGRPIEMTGSGDALGFTDAGMTTFGLTRIMQTGPYHLALTDSSVGLAVPFSPTLRVSSAITTTIDSTLAPDSVLGGGSTLAAGWVAGQDILGVDLDGDIITSVDTTLQAGSVLATGTVLASSSTLGGSLTLGGALTTGSATVLRTGSVLASGSVLAAESYLTNDIVTTGGPLSTGQVLATSVTLADDLVVTRDILLQGGSELASGSVLASASRIGGELTLTAPMTTTGETTLANGSTIRDLDGVTLLVAGSTIGGAALFAVGDLAVTSPLVVAAGSTLAVNSELALGSTIGGDAVLSGDHTASEVLYLAAGSTIATGSIIKSRTVLTNDLATTAGLYQSGTRLGADVITSGANSLTYAMTLPAGTILTGGSVLAANSRSESAVEIGRESSLRLDDISLLTGDEAAIAVKVVDAALADLERIHKQAAAVSGQLAGLASAQGGVKDMIDYAQTRMLRVDFGEETENFTRMELLVRSSSFALTQANAVPANVFAIMQGGSEQRAQQFFIAALNRILTEGALM